jgi:hypothetical protein
MLCIIVYMYALKEENKTNFTWPSILLLHLLVALLYTIWVCTVRGAQLDTATANTRAQRSLYYPMGRIAYY